MTQAELLKLQKSSQFLDEPVRIKGAQIHYVQVVILLQQNKKRREQGEKMSRHASGFPLPCSRKTDFTLDALSPPSLLSDRMFCEIRKFVSLRCTMLGAEGSADAPEVSL
jgi:hypothetical protein